MARKRRRESVPQEDLPEGCHHYDEVGEVPWDIQKYFHQRYNIFSRYDEGIWMTDDAWFGVTPEPVADKIADHLGNGTPPRKAILIDAFAGAGGNTIAFAKSGRWTRIYAIEKDPQALTCAKHNAEVYGVQDHISWYEGDCFEVIKNQLAEMGEYAVIFASPPWGGPGYRTDSIFNLSNMYPYNLIDLLGPFQEVTANVTLYLPRTSDLRQLTKSHKGDGKLVVVNYCMEGASKAICAYFGEILI
ncbi:hypothetical protein MMC13_002007 [Lambiella insularis]|nr:hypothetical protein [Lambiella insularis]